MRLCDTGSRLNDVVLSTMLPPLLEWDAGGPKLVIGGIRAEISVSSADDCTAWTAAEVPVMFEAVGNAVRLKPDPTRATTVKAVGFDQMSSLADLDKVMRIFKTAVPGLVGDIFGTLPSITMPTFDVPRLDKSRAFSVTPTITALKKEKDHYRVELKLVLKK